MSVRPGAPSIEELRNEARAQAIAWLRANNPFSANASFLPERIKQINEATEDGFVMALGANLVKSRRATFLVVRAGRFYVFELNEAQARASHLKTNTSIWVRYIRYDKAAWPQPPTVQLADLKIENAEHLLNDRPFNGTVRYRGLHEMPGNLALRITYWIGERRNNFTRYLVPKPSGDRGALAFSAGAMSKDDEAATGPQLVFVELCTVADRNRPDDATVVSNSVVALVTAVSPTEGKNKK